MIGWPKHSQRWKVEVSVSSSYLLEYVGVVILKRRYRARTYAGDKLLIFQILHGKY